MLYWSVGAALKVGESMQTIHDWVMLWYNGLRLGEFYIQLIYLTIFVFKFNVQPTSEPFWILFLKFSSMYGATMSYALDMSFYEANIWFDLLFIHFRLKYNLCNKCNIMCGVNKMNNLKENTIERRYLLIILYSMQRESTNDVIMSRLTKSPLQFCQ